MCILSTQLARGILQLVKSNYFQPIMFEHTTCRICCLILSSVIVAEVFFCLLGEEEGEIVTMGQKFTNSSGLAGYMWVEN